MFRNVMYNHVYFQSDILTQEELIRYTWNIGKDFKLGCSQFTAVRYLFDF